MQCRLTALVAIVFACPVSALLYGQQQPPIRVAEVSVASAQPVDLDTTKEWSRIPEFLKGAKICFGMPTGRELQFEAKTDGIAIIAASWTYDGNESGGWYETRTTPEQMIAKDWQAIGEIICGEKDVHKLYFRNVKAGEKVAFHTRKYNQPYVILPRPEAVALAADLFQRRQIAVVQAESKPAPSATPTAQAQTTTAAPLVGSATQEITVIDGQSAVLNTEEEWSPLPDYLRGATVLRPSKGNELVLTANQPVQVLMAASWNYDGNASGGWFETRTTLPQLIQQGWEPIGTITLKGKDAHTLLRRSLQVGEQVKLHTRKYNPPVIMIAVKEQRAAVARLTANRPPSNDLAAIRPLPSGPQATTKPAVLLRAHEPDLEDRFVERGILLRELVRQAVLLAAREELGMPTRDESLRETMSDVGEATPLPLESIVRVQQNGRVAVTLFRFADGKPEVLWDKEFSLTGDDKILALTKESEQLARNEIVAALRKVGFEGKANAVSEQQPVPEDAQPIRADLHLVPQFSVARQLHGLLRASGESPERLAALAQAYAHLGVLSEHLWYPGHKAFKARALLYAERAVARWPGSSAALCGRAHARALVGLHQAALDDLQAAKRAEPSAMLPIWEPAVSSLCRFDLEKLELLAQPEDGLARLLRLMALERYGGTKAILDAAERFLAVVPDSDRAIDAIYETRHLGTRGQAAALGRERISAHLYGRLEKVGDLPGLTKRVVAEELLARKTGVDEAQERQRRLLATRTLRDAGRSDFDRGEPSWEALAALLEETAFIQVERQVEYLGRSLSVGADDTLRELTPLIADHLLRPFVESFTGDRTLRDKKLRELFGSYRPQDLTLNELYMVQYLEGNGIRLNFRVSSLVMTHQDHVYRDLLQNARNTRELFWKTYSGELRRVSPFSPLTIATSAEYDWEYAAPLAAEWEQRYALSPQVMAALGRQYLRQEKYSDSVRCLAQAAKLLPEYNVYEPLARAWLKQKNEMEWQKTWDDYLQQEDYGLSHERARVNVAEYFMRQGKWDKALPYAQDAANSGAQWTLECAADCLTGLGRYEQAEEYIRSAAMGYVESSPTWFFWCRRTGRGDRGEARDFVRKAMANRFVGLNLNYKLAFLVLDNDKEAALAGYRESLARVGSPQFAWMAALLADELKQPDVRDASLKTVRETANHDDYKRPFLGEAAALAQEALADAAKLAELPKRATELIAKIEDPREAATVTYLLGKLLDLHGMKDGIALFKEAARLPFTHPQAAMAAAELHDRKIPLDDKR